MIYIEKILEELKRNNLKMSDLADELGVNKSVVSTWKSRKKNPPLEYLVQICKLLKITPNDLLGVDDVNKSEIDRIYKQLDPVDKQVVDIIFDKYREENAELSSSKIG